MHELAVVDEAEVLEVAWTVVVAVAAGTVAVIVHWVAFDAVVGVLVVVAENLRLF